MNIPSIPDPYVIYAKLIIGVCFLAALIGFGYHLGSNHYAPIIANLNVQKGNLEGANSLLSLSLDAQTKNVEAAQKQYQEAMDSSKKALEVVESKQKNSLAEIAFYKKEIYSPGAKTCADGTTEIRRNLSVK